MEKGSSARARLSQLRGLIEGRHYDGGTMHALVLFAVLHGVISISPIREFRPYPTVKCPKGYTLWWPAGREFDNDRYAQCVQPIAAQKIAAPKASTVVKDVSLRQKLPTPVGRRGNETGH